jgi:hypothetical protein
MAAVEPPSLPGTESALPANTTTPATTRNTPTTRHET